MNTSISKTLHLFPKANRFSKTKKGLYLKNIFSLNYLLVVHKLLINRNLNYLEEWPHLDMDINLILQKDLITQVRMYMKRFHS